MRIQYITVLGLSTLACNASVDLGQRGGEGGEDIIAAGGSSRAGSGGSSLISPMGGAPATGGTPSTSTGGAGAGGGSVSTGGVVAGGAASTGGESATGGATATGGSTSVATGGSITGGANATGGTMSAVTGGSPTGGTNATGGTTSAATGGSPTGGTNATGGTMSAVTGGSPTGGTNATGGSVAATGGSGVGGGSSVTGPCDIYAAANPATPCVAAYSTTRLLRAAYAGALYQVRKGGGALGTGGAVQDIMQVGGFADGASQDTFCGTSTCTVSILYDQSGNGNDLTVAPAGCYTGTASEPDYESNAKGKTIQISGHKVYALYMIAHDGYRNNTPSGMPTGSAAQGIYEIADGARTPLGSACCWDFGNASTNNCNQGTMNAMYFGTGYWGKGAGSGPWFLADLEGGVWAGGTGASTVVNPNLPSSKIPFAFGILKTSTSNYVIRVGDATSGTLTTGNNSGLPKTLNSPGGIILGIGGDNSNSSLGTFFEGAITAGQPSDATDALVLANVQAAKYGQ